MFNKSFNDVVMDRARMPRDSVPVTATQTQAFKDGKVLTDDGNAYRSCKLTQTND